MPLSEPSTTAKLLEILLKPYSLIANPIAERIGNRLKRKPKLHFNIYPPSSLWCYAWNGYGENAKPMMQVRFSADITNDGHKGILILAGYVKGTKAKLPLVHRIEIPPTTTVVAQSIAVFVEPVIGEGGMDFTGKVVLIDQLKRKHTTEKIKFTWVGTTEKPKQPSGY